MPPAITLLFSTTTGILSKVIRWFTKSQASHVAIGTEMHGVPVVIESTLGGVRIYPRKRWLKANRLVAEYAFGPNVEADMRYAIECVGDRYDYMGLIGQFFVVVARWIGRRIKNPFNSPKAMFCSEFVLRFNRDGVIPEWAGLVDDGTVTPNDFLRLCRLGGSFALVASGKLLT